jgi:hypothetical protein
MLKSILAIIVGYLAMFILFMALSAGLYFVLGIERVFQADSYEISRLWIGVTIAVGFLSTIFAGYLCAAISGRWLTCQIFALIVFLLTLWQCVSALRSNSEGPNVRAGEVTFLEAITHAVAPMWLHFVNPVVNGVGVLLGARLKRRGNV